MTKQEFIKEAQDVHGDIFDYSNFEYKNMVTSSIISCKKHGEFIQTPNNHFHTGCPSCGYERRQQIDISEVKRLIACTGLGFVSYISKTEIILQDNIGNVKVSMETLRQGRTPNIGTAVNKTLYFITMAKEVHGSKYDYYKTRYIKSTSKIKIVCPDHGGFEQTPFSHLQGKGCRECGLKRQGIRSGIPKGIDQNIINFKL